jgi:hypothetical protein
MDDALAHSILARHGVDGPFDTSHPLGNVCFSFFTTDVVLKVPRRDFEGSAAREAFAGPAAKAAGVTTANLIAFAEDRIQGRNTPYTIWERKPGAAPESGSGVWSEVGKQIARLHLGVTSGGEQQIYRDGALLENLNRPSVEHALQSRGLYDRVAEWAFKLEAWRDQTCANCFLHADVHRTNILTHADGGLSAIVDWGDAGWGDPAYDLSRAPCAALPLLFEAYVAAGGPDLGEHSRGRILRYRLARILRWLSNGRQEGTDLEELLHFGAEPPEEWTPYGL